MMFLKLYNEMTKRNWSGRGPPQH